MKKKIHHHHKVDPKPSYKLYLGIAVLVGLAVLGYLYFKKGGVNNLLGPLIKEEGSSALHASGFTKDDIRTYKDKTPVILSGQSQKFGPQTIRELTFTSKDTPEWEYFAYRNYLLGNGWKSTNWEWPTHFEAEKNLPASGNMSGVTYKLVIDMIPESQGTSVHLKETQVGPYVTFDPNHLVFPPAQN